MVQSQVQLSIVVPVYNEQAGLAQFHTLLTKALRRLKLPYEVIYCNDGSRDDTLQILRRLSRTETSIRYLTLSRNFGKELAVTAGLHAARGQAVLTLDADGQHPVDRITDFVAAWQAGAKVVVGVRKIHQHGGRLKRLGSKYFYQLFNRFSGAHLVPGATDFRLIDRSVQQEFVRLTERNRITRGLVDWLGYHPTYLEFAAAPRLAGNASYSLAKLVRLAIDSVISLSVSPLYVVAYVGIVVLPLSLLLGFGMLINALANDPLGLHATGGAYLAVFTLCLVGLLMVSQGIIGLYLSHIHAETQNRPLYIIDEVNSLQ